MRIGLPAILFIFSAVWAASAQPPTTPPGPDKFIIRPGGKGAVDPREDRPAEKAGFIIIRPNGKTTSSPTTDSPRQPTLIAGRPTAGSTLKVPPPGPPSKEGLFDYWFAVAVEGQRIGHVNWSAKEVQQKDKSFVHGVRYLNLTVARFGQMVAQWSEESTVESPEGEVYTTSMRQGIGMDQALALTGTVEGKTLKVTGGGAAAGAGNTPWPAGVVGVAREPQLFKEIRNRGVESLEYPSYVPTMNRVVRTTLIFEGEETRALWDKSPPRKLLRFNTKPEPIGKVKLPALPDVGRRRDVRAASDGDGLSRTGRPTDVSPDDQGGRNDSGDPARRGLQDSIHRAEPQD